MAEQQRSIIWIDFGGSTTQTLVRADPNAGSIQSALLGHSIGDILNWWEGPPNINSTPAPGTSTYAPIGDHARLLFLDSASSLVTLTLPAPNLNVFFADGVTVDPSAIADVIAAFVANGKSATGNSIASFVAGNLIRKRVLAI